MMMPIKHAAHFLNGAAFKPSDWGEEGLPILRIAQLTGKPFDNYFNGTINRGLLIKNGDLLFSWSATIDAFIWERGDAILNQHIFKVFPKKIADKNYLYYLIKAHAPRWAEDDAHGSTMRHIKKGSLSNKVWVPDLSTQQRIAAFLNRETARIDELISKKERLLSALDAKLRVAITRAVTQGINPDAGMQDSEVDWIGQVPTHWFITKLGYLGRCANGINIGGDAFGSGFPFISYGDVYKNRVLPNTGSGLVQSSVSDRDSYAVRAGDVFFTRTSETIEEVGFSSVCMETIENAVFAGFLIRFRPSKGKLHPLFSKFAFQHSGLRDYFAKEMNLITRASLSQDLLRNLPVALPPMEEQEVIGHHLERLEAATRTISCKTRETIEKLKERRAALITAAVTGQIDVDTYGKAGTTSETLDRIKEEMQA